MYEVARDTFGKLLIVSESDLLIPNNIAYGAKQEQAPSY